MTATQIPCLDFAHRESAEFAAELSRSFADIGFGALVNHGLSVQLRADAFRVVSEFFALPLEAKREYFVANGGGARGYTPFGVETAKDASTPDLKEFYHVGRELPEEARTSTSDNIWPHEVTGFRDTMLEIYSVLDGIGDCVLCAVAQGLGLEPGYFSDKTNSGNSLVRALHYPPLSGDTGGAVRAAPHEDINLITLLIGTPQPGLEVLTKSGQWLEAPSGSELILCNVGDMLQRLTNHELVSTTHRVVNPVKERRVQSRYALPFFLHPNSDFLIETLPGCITPKNPDRYPVSLSADEFLQQRLREIGLI